MGDQPTRDDAGDRDLPGRKRRGRTPEGGAAEPVTVEQLLARQGNDVGGRRAARRSAVELRPRGDRARPAERGGGGRGSAPEGPAVRSGLPPVPGAARADQVPGAQPGFPPVPGARSGRAPGVPAQSGFPPVPGAQPGLPPVPTAAPGRPGAVGTPAAWAPDERPSRRSGPVPPLPGLAPPPSSGATRRRVPAERPPRSPGRRRLVRAATALAAVVGLVVLYHLALYFYVDQRIDRVDALALDGPEILAPDLQEAAQTYLVVGTGVPGQSGAASVATLVVSVSAEGDRAALVSVPPTALVDTPACRTPDGTLRQPVTEAFASSLLEGGPACTVRAVQQLSGLRIDHYLGVDLTRLPGMVDALGGVPVCVVPSAAIAAAATPPPAGPSDLSGAAASGFLEPGDGEVDMTGAAVAERAQRLLTSTMRAAMTADTLLDPVTLTRFLSRASDALTLDDQTTLGDLRALAGTLGDLSGDAVQRAGLPVAQVGYVPAGTDQAYVVLDASATRALFDEVIDGAGVPAELLTVPDPAPEAAEPEPAPEAATPSVPEPLTSPPGEITVDVLNGTATSGLAATVADALRAQGFGIGTVGNETGTVTGSVVRYGPEALDRARTVAAAVPGSVLQPGDALGDSVQLVVGPGYSAVVPVEVGAPEPVAAAPDTAAAAPEPEAAAVRC
ncbi:LytR family transcriptional regulator [Blastococcus sp. KM273128]|uniref:LytR C-terminal domain-containing protein n=1 Tax=Blastococcus sp. KM273128 TaxID=2570314 RepID=UPI001F24B6B9|nr:LytR C-terminal domain-containing protein [Blastococcus sp. KM273128]MCF6743827.1 LytR family transcriptional regulator [Blastococcus sp. KM273128]